MTSRSRVGEVLASKYRLDELIGRGGMGEVYRAVNQDVGRIVAIKVLLAEHARNAPLVERFLREARAANLVRHPNVVDVPAKNGYSPSCRRERESGSNSLLRWTWCSSART
mgnify:CR=1 FL=1